MEIIIKILFILSLFSCNVNILSVVMKMKNEEMQRASFMLLCGFNIFAVSAILGILHPTMLTALPELTFSSFIGGAVIFAVSTIPFTKGAN